MRHGLPATTPAALVEQASLPGQRCVSGTLQDLPGLARHHGVRPPALIVVGEVVALRPQLLKGMQADFILVDVDPLAAPPQELLRAKVAQTWVGGRLVYKRTP